MVLGERQRGAGGIAVLEMPPVSATIEEREEPEEKDLEKARSSLTVIENPSLYGYLGILMAKDTVPSFGSEAFLDVYFIMADKDYKVISQPLIHSHVRATAQQVGNQLLYIASDENNRPYPTASLVPYESCRISPKEFQGFEANLSAGKLEGMVNDIVQLIGQRVNIFSLDNRKLILPQNYASTPLRY